MKKIHIITAFLFFGNAPGISIEEAYRFLNNRSLEKLMHKKKFEKVSEDISLASNEKQSRRSGNGKKKAGYKFS